MCSCVIRQLTDPPPKEAQPESDAPQRPFANTDKGLRRSDRTAEANRREVLEAACCKAAKNRAAQPSDEDSAQHGFRTIGIGALRGAEERDEPPRGVQASDVVDVASAGCHASERRDHDRRLLLPAHLGDFWATVRDGLRFCTSLTRGPVRTGHTRRCLVRTTGSSSRRSY